jgi:YggT family protein
MQDGADFITQIICVALFLYWIVLFIRVILSWVQLAGWRPPYGGPLRAAYDLILDMTEPPLRLLRRIVPPAGMFDLSVLVAFVVILVLRRVFC